MLGVYKAYFDCCHAQTCFGFNTACFMLVIIFYRPFFPLYILLPQYVIMLAKTLPTSNPSRVKMIITVKPFLNYFVALYVMSVVKFPKISPLIYSKIKLTSIKQMWSPFKKFPRGPFFVFFTSIKQSPSQL